MSGKCVRSSMRGLKGRAGPTVSPRGVPGIDQGVAEFVLESGGENKLRAGGEVMRASVTLRRGWGRVLGWSWGSRVLLADTRALAAV